MGGAIACVCLVALGAVPAAGQAPLPSAPASVPGEAPPPTAYPPTELDRIVSPVALYPDPLLAQVLTAATFSDEIPDAARWADEHHYVAPESLPAAIAADQVLWDPSVQALLPFPSVLDVQRMRQRARDFGYLRATAAYTVSSGPYIEILPADPSLIVVPYYDPAVVFVAPRRGFAVAGAIRVGSGVRLGATFAPWGWGSTRFAWGERVVIVNNVRWERTWANRATYVHPYAVRRYSGPRPAEAHRLIGRSPREREDERNGRGRQEEHRH